MGYIPPPPDLSLPQTLFFPGIGNSTLLPTRSPRPSSPPASAPPSSPPLTPSTTTPSPPSSPPTNTERLNDEELLRLVPCAKAKVAYLISVMSSEVNGLVAVCDLNVYLSLERELCPFSLAPVMSTAILIVFRDMVAVAMNLTWEEYAANHPAKRIGIEELDFQGECFWV
ncbi:hypothetical protein RHSIM_Rhsim05G0133300 [Rhododendron simsii]|uniref:Uncharacterized protein n=1 Tax=Rhododendron simsii TaxID=118357 RepID=A0A834H1M2_RHOSS|nr:hypothetical protein RHSIM_Rhsim05G0133300 [Rhododendron simsii]